jgi:hypothetical protein
MKTRTSLGWVLGMVLAGGTVAAGFAQDGLNPSQTAVSSGKTGTAAPSPAAAAVVEPGTPPQTAPEPSTPAPAAPGTADGKALASNRYVSPWIYEIERLTQAGVEESVVLSYINNSAGTFGLTADQLISLKALGASPQVISAMLEHDRELISGERPMTASAPPPLPPSVEATFAAAFPAASPASAEPATLATPLPPANGSIIAQDDEPGAGGTWVWVEPGDAPEQPASAGPVRMPYPVKLNNPIIILKLPTFAHPCW